MLEKFKNMKIGPKLIALFLTVGIIPLAIIGITSYNIASEALSKAAFNQLGAVRAIKAKQIETFFGERKGDMGVLVETVSSLRQEAFDKLGAVQRIKKNQIEQYFAERSGDVSVLSGNDVVKKALKQFGQAFKSEGNKVNGSKWLKAKQTFGPWLTQYKTEYGYYDLFLINADGDVVYTVAEESDLGENLLNGSLRNSPAAKGLRGGLREIFLQDFEPYAPSNGEPCAFIAAPLKSGQKKLGVVMLQISLDQINKIMQERSGLGTTGETYLVGPDKLMRSDSFLDPKGHSVTASFAGTVEHNGVDTEAVREALSGRAGAKIIKDYRGELVLSSYAPVKLKGLNWVVLSEIDVVEAFVPKLEGSDKDFFTKYKEMYGYYDLFLIDTAGLVFYSVTHEADYNTNMINGQYRTSGLGKLTRQVIGSKKFGMADFEPYAPSNDEPASFIAQPVINNKGEVECVVALQISLEGINAIMGERSGMGKTGETYLVGQDMLMRSDSYLDPENHSVLASFKNPSKGKVDTEASQEALSGKTDAKIVIDYNGNPVLSAFSLVKVAEGISWGILAEIDEAEAMGPVKSLASWVFGIGLLIAALVGALGFFIARSISDPIVKMADVVGKVAQDGDLTQTVEISSSDEIGILGTAFNKMTAALNGMANAAEKIANKDLTVELEPRSDKDVLGKAFKSMVEGLREMVGQITSTSSQVASAADEISAATNQITKGAESQASAADETGSTMEEMSFQIQSVAKSAESLAANVDETTSSIQQMGSTSEGVAKNAEAMAGNVSETSSSIEQMLVTIEKTAKNVEEADKLSQQSKTEAEAGGEAVMKTVDGMKNISKMMGNISETIQALGLRSEAIGSIIEVIEEIADQTNLLALNAAIEAARAGEAGRGFAVVADEVRKLAERSINATKEIGDVIKQVQEETAEAVKATDEGAKNSEKGIEIADQAGTAISRIVESVGASSKIMGEISRATAEQSTAAKNVSDAVDDMNKLTQSVTQSTTEQASGIGQIVKASESMAQMTEQVKNATAEQKQGGENVVKAVENISEIAKSNLSAVEQLSRSAKDLAQQSEGLQAMTQEFKLQDQAQESKSTRKTIRVVDKAA